MSVFCLLFPLPLFQTLRADKADKANKPSVYAGLKTRQVKKK